MKVLAQFKSMPSYVDFCLSELKSLLEVFSLDWREVFRHEFVGDKKNTEICKNDSIENAEETESMKKGKKLENEEEDLSEYDDEKGYYYFYQQFEGRSKKGRDKRLPFPENLSEIRHSSFRRFPFIFLEFPSAEIAQQLISRSILLDVFIEIISEADNYKDLVKNVNHELLAIHNDPELRILFEVDPYNSHLAHQEVIDRIEILTESLHMKGQVDLKNPQKKFWVMERHVLPYTRHTDSSITCSLLDIFFGVEVGRSKISTRVQQKENIMNRYDLKNRIYLGPTSTENTLSFLMSNQGQVKQGDLILDPFVGSGSLLIPPSHYGAICLGGDLDLRVLHGYGVGRINKKSTFYLNNQEYCNSMKPKIMLNFEQYELPKPTIIRMDCMNPSLRDLEIFDAIICDPPYGSRAMTRTTQKKEKIITSKDRQSTTATTQEDECFEDDDEQGEEKHNKLAPSKALHEVIEEMASQKGTISHHAHSHHPHRHELNNINDEDSDEDSSIRVQREKINNQINKNQQEERKRTELNKENEGTEEETKEEAKIDLKRKPHRPSEALLIQTSMDNIVEGLIALANRVLIPGGKLVFLYPMDKDKFVSKGLSQFVFPNFTLLDYSENPITEKKCRILITLKKNHPIAIFNRMQAEKQTTSQAKQEEEEESKQQLTEQGQQQQHPIEQNANESAEQSASCLTLKQ